MQHSSLVQSSYMCALLTAALAHLPLSPPIFLGHIFLCQADFCTT